MTTNRIPFDAAPRALCAAAVLGSLFLCHTAPPPGAPATDSLDIFLLVTALCAALALLTRGWGVFAGTSVGFVVGLSAALGLTHSAAAPLAHQLAFTIIAVVALGLLGCLAGSWNGSASEAENGWAPQDDSAWRLAKRNQD